jgi:hypothetical protein
VEDYELILLNTIIEISIIEAVNLLVVATTFPYDDKVSANKVFPYSVSNVDAAVYIRKYGITTKIAQYNSPRLEMRKSDTISIRRAILRSVLRHLSNGLLGVGCLTLS